MISLRRLLGLAVALVAAMVVAAPAWAGQWSWSGMLYPGSGGRDGTCIWYPSRSSCSGWNYWDFHLGAQDNNGWYVKVLVGFENNQRIRGVWLRQGESVIVEPRHLGMCCYLKAVATHWEGDSAFLMRDWALAA
jgi:hypothetical protein